MDVFLQQIIIVTIGVVVGASLPSDFGPTIHNGYCFFSDIAKGWNMGYVSPYPSPSPYWMITPVFNARTTQSHGN